MTKICFNGVSKIQMWNLILSDFITFKLIVVRECVYLCKHLKHSNSPDVHLVILLCFFTFYAIVGSNDFSHFVTSARE